MEISHVRNSPPPRLADASEMAGGSIGLVQTNALREVAALQGAIVNSATFAIVATDAKGIIQLFNAGAERMFGYRASDVLNKFRPNDLHDPQEVLAHALALSSEFSTEIAPGFEALAYRASRNIEDVYQMTYIRKDGSRFPGLVSVTALRDDHGDAIGYLMIGSDYSASRLAEEARQTSEARLNGLVTSVLGAIIAIDANHCITLFNPAAEQMFGVTSDAVLGTNLDRFIPSRFRSSHSKSVQEFGKTRTSARSMGHLGEIFGLHADGKEFPVDASIAQHLVNGEKVFTVVLRDVSERERLYHMLEERTAVIESAKSAAEAANHAKSEFLSSMSHELRTPLNAILGFAQLLEAGSPLPTISQQGKIDQISKAGWYLLDLINEILDLSMVESGKLSLSQEPVSLAAVMLECQAMVEPQAQRHGIAVTFSKLDESSHVVRADRTRLKQVLVNLLSNAIKYNKPGGTVALDCAASAPGRIRISVADTGDGLAPESLAQLFQPFNRLGRETGGEEGTGIGLVVTKRLIELMGGMIGVQSTVGRGSEFWVELDLAPEPTVSLAPVVHEPVARSRVQAEAPQCTLLYVEDNPANLMLVEEMIASRPEIRFLSATDGNQGIEMARGSLPDVILMDINLPGISGIQALKVLRAEPATAHIPVIALSANAMAHDVETGLAAGFCSYVTKPIRINQLMDALDVAMKFPRTTALRG